MWVVVCKPEGKVAMEVYGPYRVFRHAERDARAWDGSVEVVLSPAFKYAGEMPMPQQVSG